MRFRPRPTIHDLDPARGEDFTDWPASAAGQDVLSRVRAADAAWTPEGAAAERPRRRPLRLGSGLAVAAVSVVLLVSFALLPGVLLEEPSGPPQPGPVTSGPAAGPASRYPLQRLSVLLLSAGVAAPSPSAENTASVNTLVREVEALRSRIEEGSLVGRSGPADSTLALSILTDLSTALQGADISVVLAADITPEERAALRRAIASFPETRASAYVTAEEAWVRVQAELPPGVVGDIDENPLPASIEVALLSPELVAPVAARIAVLPGVRQVISGQALAPGVIHTVEAGLLLPTEQ